MARAVGRFRVAAWCALSIASSGCAVPNLYTTPRATQVSKFVGVLAPQLVAQPELRNQAYALQLGGRLGLAKRFDAGARSNLAGALAADVKWNAIRSKYFDVALDGGVEVLPKTFYVDMPILFGLNLTDSVSILPNTGITLGEGTQPTMDSREINDNDPRPRRPAGRVLIRAGMGAQFRLTPHFAVIPEFTYVGPLDGGAHGTSEYFAFGIGFGFGPQPY